MCMGQLKHSHVNFEGILPKKKYPAVRLHASGSVRCDASISAHKIMSEV